MSEGNQSCKPTGFSRGYLTQNHIKPLMADFGLDKKNDVWRDGRKVICDKEIEE